MTIKRLCRLMPPHLVITCAATVSVAAAAPIPRCWRVIPQLGRVWREPGDGNWSRAVDRMVPF